MIPLVVASERGLAQTYVVYLLHRGCRSTLLYKSIERHILERITIQGDSPVLEVRFSIVLS